jgi:hypothetical protein
MSRRMKKIILFTILGIIIIILFFLFYKHKNERTTDIFIGANYSVDSIDKIVIFHENNNRIYEDDEDIRLIMESLKLVGLTYLHEKKDSNGWVYTLKVYINNQVVDTVLVHNYIVKYNRESYKSEKNIVLVLDEILDKINE